MPRYRTRIVEIEAIEWTGSNPQEVLSFAHGTGKMAPDGSIFIDTLEGTMRASKGDFIIRGLKGEFYPCKPDIFAAKYEAI
jgi:hypothetical protein